MKSTDEIEKAIDEIKTKITNCKLKRIQYEARKDHFMFTLLLNEEAQFHGQLSALNWVLGLQK